MNKKMLFVFNPKAGKGKIKTNLLDIAETDSALYEFEILITAYRSMISANIDFEEELLVFEHDW